MWFGTNDGLNRYNGHDFKVYHNEIDSEMSLTSNQILKIFEDSNENLWVLTSNGVNKLNPDRNNVIQYSNLNEKGSLSGNKLTDMLITSDGKILLATSNGIDVYNKDENRFEPFLDEETLRSPTVYSLEEDEFGYIWIGTEEGVDVVNKNGLIKNSFIYEGENNNKLRETVKKIYYDKDGVLWISTDSLALAKINTKSETIEEYEKITSKAKSIQGNFVKDFLRDRYDNLWICTANGFLKIDEKRENFKMYNHDLYDENSLLSDTVLSIYEDNTGIIWVGTHSGINIFHPNNSITTYKSRPMNKDTLSDSNVKSVYEDKFGYIWVGTDSKGVDILDIKENKVVHRLNTETIKDFKNDNINSITGNSEKVFIGTNDGLSIINLQTKNIYQLGIEEGLNDMFVRCLYLDNEYLWIGTNKGTNIYNIDTGEIIDIKDYFKDTNIDVPCSCVIFKDSSGIYWLGSYLESGLIEIDPYNRKITKHIYNEENLKAISNDEIRSIAEDSKGNIWIGTKIGLNVFNRSTNEFKTYTTKDGLPNNDISAIIIDDDDNPWMSTNTGIAKFDIKENRFIKLDITDGLQGNEFNPGSYYKTKENQFLFGGVNGLNLIKPDKIINSDSNTKVSFDQFEINGVTVDSIDGKKLEQNENTISIKVFLPEYRNTRSIEYYYYLDDGKNSEWLKMNGNEVRLSNLASGKYTLRVRAINSNGAVTDESEVNFLIKKPFWKSKTAIVIYIILGALVLYYQKYKVKKLDKLVDIRTKELSNKIRDNEELFDRILVLERNKNNYFINLSHELRTPLNVLSSLLQVVSHVRSEGGEIGIDTLNHYVSIADKNINRLLQTINDIMDASKFQNGNYTITLKENNIVNVVEDAALSLKDYVESNGNNLIIDTDVEEKIVRCDATEIERCIVNLVANANKFTSNGGTIKVDIKDLGEKVQIEVKDDGEGIAKEYHEAIFNRFNQVMDSETEAKCGSGLGLTITKNLIELHGGTIRVESELGAGSTFIIVLPDNL